VVATPHVFVSERDAPLSSMSDAPLSVVKDLLRLQGISPTTDIANTRPSTIAA
jgi:hypothetical protein